MVLQLEDLRFELESIKVVGKNAPKPVKKWSQMGLSTRVFEVRNVHASHIVVYV